MELCERFMAKFFPPGSGVEGGEKGGASTCHLPDNCLLLVNSSRMLAGYKLCNVVFLPP